MIGGEPVQRVRDYAAFEVIHKVAKEEEMEEIIKDFAKHYDLSKASLLRVVLIEVSKEKHYLLYDMHHIISDGTSVRSFMKELAGLYNGEKLPELRLQYKDFSAWQNKLMETEVFKNRKNIG